jgi:tRNA(Ile2)-agmatinylcytidine synthase
LRLLENPECKFLDYPNLIRLNPNIPWKTRGNAALALRLKTRMPRKELFRTCTALLQRFATSPRANSGLVLFEGREVPEEIKEFSRRALSSVLSLKEARTLIERHNIDSFALRLRQGLVGALAAIGNTLDRDYTFELISYRGDTRIPRKLDRARIVSMSRKTFPRTFSSYDESSGRIMISPHGPDPVLCGIRGESAMDVLRAFRMLRPIENLRGWMIFRSNQGTGEHLRETIDLGQMKSYYSGLVHGTVSSPARIEKGGHAFFTVRNDDGEIPCACYEPTGEFRKFAMELIPGDEIEAAGGIRRSTRKHAKILNLEYFIPLKLARRIVYSNPKCTTCGLRMKSKGRKQGFACPRCGFHDRELEKIALEQTRNLELKKMYLPPIRAHRHLAKPLQRYSLAAKKAEARLIDNWLGWALEKSGKNQSRALRSL